MEWSNEVLVSQIGDFVKFYPNFRIIVVDLALKSSKAADWKGEEYESNERTLDKVVKLWSDFKKIANDLFKLNYLTFYSIHRIKFLYSKNVTFLKCKNLLLISKNDQLMSFLQARFDHCSQ